MVRSRLQLLLWLRRSTGTGVQAAHKVAFNDAGWHFSYFMSTEEIVRKLHAFAHTEFAGAVG